MKPRTDSLGVELGVIDVYRIQEFQGAVTRAGLKPRIPECFGGEPFNVERLKGTDHVLLGRRATRKLYTLVFDAVGVYKEDYEKASDKHADICRTEDITTRKAASHLVYLECTMELALLNHQDAKEFTELIDQNLLESGIEVAEVLPAIR